MVKYVRAGEVDVRPGQVDFHIHVVRRCGRIDVYDRFIVRVVDEPADAVCGYSAGCDDGPLNKGRARNGRSVDMI